MRQLFEIENHCNGMWRLSRKRCRIRCAMNIYERKRIQQFNDASFLLPSYLSLTLLPFANFMFLFFCSAIIVVKISSLLTISESCEIKFLLSSSTESLIKFQRRENFRSGAFLIAISYKIFELIELRTFLWLISTPFLCSVGLWSIYEI